MPLDVQLESADLSLGDVESSYSSARLFANIVADKKLRSSRTRS